MSNQTDHSALIRYWPVVLTLALIAYYALVLVFAGPSPTLADGIANLWNPGFVMLMLVASVAFTIIYLAVYTLALLFQDADDPTSTLTLSVVAVIIFGALITVWLTFFRPFAY